ncbi:MAG: GNAT family N-acetyltransferase [Anaerolineae bacterium]
MIDLDRFRNAELSFCGDFADREERPYGVLYHNVDVPESHDSNHAVVLDDQADPDTVVADVVRFYEERNLVPRLYSALLPGQLARLRPALQANGFTVRDFFDPRPRWFVCSGPSVISPNPALQVRQVHEMDEEVARLVSEEGEFPWTLELFRRRWRSAAYHQFIGYLGETAVTMGSFTTLDGISRVDDVVTREAHRGHGYARTLMHELVARHAEVSANPLYLWVTNPVAMRVYQDAGFVEQPVPFEAWTAWKPAEA